MEEGNQSGDLAISGHGNAQEEYDIRREEKEVSKRIIKRFRKSGLVRRPILLVCFK